MKTIKKMLKTFLPTLLCLGLTLTMTSSQAVVQQATKTRSFPLKSTLLAATGVCISLAMSLFAISIVADIGYAMVKQQLPKKKPLTPLTPESIKKTLGYDPQGIVEGKKNLSVGDVTKIDHFDDNQFAVIFSHGLADAKNTFQFIDEYGNIPVKEAIPIAFNYKDFNYKIPHIVSYWGQDGDAVILLAHIIACFNRGCKKVIGFGHSRGGAAWIYALSALRTPQKYCPLWQMLGFDIDNQKDLKRISEIKQTVQEGKIFLACPLLGYKETFKQLFTPGLAAFAIMVLNVITPYLPFREEPLNIIKDIAEKGDFIIDIYLAPPGKDHLLGHKADTKIKLYAKSSKQNINVFEQKKDKEQKLAQLLQKMPPEQKSAFLKKSKGMKALLTHWFDDYHSYIDDSEEALRQYCKSIGNAAPINPTIT